MCMMGVMWRGIVWILIGCSFCIWLLFLCRGVGFFIIMYVVFLGWMGVRL